MTDVDPLTPEQLTEIEKIAREAAEAAVESAFRQLLDHLAEEEAARG